MDNIILYTKIFQSSYSTIRTDFNLVQRKWSPYIHVEDTFLASKNVDYLNYTSTPIGIQSQMSKVIAILRLAGYKTKK